MKRTVFSAILLFVAAVLTAFCIAEISFPETFLTISDKDWFIDIFPNGWKYNVQIGIGALVVACGLLLPVYKLDKVFALKGIETLCRLGIGGMFIFASIFKIEDPHQFATLTAQYQFFGAFGLENVTNFFSLVYPMFEFWFGLAMIVTPFVRESALAIFGMFVSFIIALAWALFKDLGITCGCFNLEGAQDKAEAWTSLIRDLILIWPTLWLAFRKNRSLIGVWKNRI